MSSAGMSFMKRGVLGKGAGVTWKKGPDFHQARSSARVELNVGAPRSDGLSVVVSVEEMRKLLMVMTGEEAVMGKLLYGCG